MNDKKHKLLIISSFADSLVRFRFDLIKDAISRNSEVHVCAPDVSPDIFKTLTEVGVLVHDIRLVRTGINPIGDVATFIDLFRLIKSIKPSHVLSYTIKPVVYGCLVARLCGVKRIYALITGLGYAFMETSSTHHKIIGIVAKTLYKTSLKGCLTVFFQNPDDQHLFEEMGLAKPKQTFVVNGSGINIQAFPSSALPNNDVIHFVMIARLIKDKGIFEYIEAAKLVKQKYSNTVFNLVGWVDTNPTAVKQYELDQWIRDGVINFHGKLNDVRPIIADSHVYVLPSYREGTPRTVLEAMSMGRAVITTDVPGCRETVEPGINGLLCKVEDAKSLASAIQTMIENPKKIAEFGNCSREIVEQKYDVVKVNKVMLDILLEA